MRRLLLVLVAWVLLAGTAQAADSTTSTGFAHVEVGHTFPSGKALLVVHGANSDASPPRGRPEKLLRYVQNHTGDAKGRLDSRAAGEAWGRQTAASGWGGAFVDRTDWRDDTSKAVVAGIRAGLGRGKLLVLNGYPFHSGDLKRNPSMVADALTVADGFQIECAALGDAKTLLRKYAQDVVLWLVCGQQDDSRWRDQFAKFRAGPEQFYGIRLNKLSGGTQTPKNGTPPKRRHPGHRHTGQHHPAHHR
jgi:hypothetical protein